MMAVGKRIRKNFVKLVELGSGNPEVRTRILEHADDDLVNAVCECASNVAQGNVMLTQQQRRRLNKYKRLTRKICRKKYPVKKRRKLLQQQGGFLPALLAPVLGIVGSLIGGLVNK
jgi:hypothetical protein